MIVLECVYGRRGSGFSILVDRIWPRGLTKEKVNADIWMKEIAPSTELRKWFGHDAEKWEEFRVKYKKELANRDIVEKLREIKRLETEKGKIILLFGAKDDKHNQAVVLKEVLDSLDFEV